MTTRRYCDFCEKEVDSYRETTSLSMGYQPYRYNRDNPMPRFEYYDVCRKCAESVAFMLDAYKKDLLKRA